MSKAKKITAITLACVFAVLSIVMLFWYFGESYGDFYKIANKEFNIPGLSEGFTPQGLCYENTTNSFMVSGYMKNGSASRIYVVDAKTYKSKGYFTLFDSNGKDYVGHAGGIATDGNSVWVCGDGNVVRFSMSQIRNFSNRAKIDILDSFDVLNGADFVTVQQNHLWVGEFHRDGKYDTQNSHHVETSDGTTNKAISFCFKIDSTKEFGLVENSPIKALSTPSLVQGIEFVNQQIVLSTSYSLAKSQILVYENILSKDADKQFIYDDVSIPLYVLENDDLIKQIEAPCMSEEIVYAYGRLYIMFESACSKYNFITRESLRHSYSIKL